MKKYFLNDGVSQQGPFDIDELKGKNITADTPIWYEGLPEWTTAGKLDELKSLFVVAPPPFAASTPIPVPVEEVKPVAPVEEVASPAAVTTAASATTTVAAAATTANAPVAKPAKVKVASTRKKGPAGVSWALSLLVLAGAGFFIFQDMQKNGGNTATASATSGSDTASTSMSTSDTSAAKTTQQGQDVTTNSDTAVTTTPTTTTPTTTTPTTTTPTTTTATNPNNTTAQTAAQKAAAKKAEEDKKKQLAAQAAAKKAEDDKRKMEQAKAAAAARELEQRSHWSKYISIGNLNYDTKGDGIKAFDVPVYNGTDAMLDKVTFRIEYVKKNEKKIFKTENITVYNIPARGGLNGKAPDSKKGESVNVIITSINSRALHFCYPQGSGNPGDPYYCN